MRAPPPGTGPILLSTALLGLVLVAGCDKAPQQRAARAVEAVRVVADPITFERDRTRVEAVGTSRALRSVELHPAASGEVVAVKFEPGQAVRQGEVLVELDSRDEKLAVELAQVRLKEAETLYERYKRSAASGAVLPTQLDAAATQYEAARIERDRARVALADRYVRAPISGFVDYTEVDPGDRIGPDTVITVLDDRSALLVSFEVPELLVGQLKVGDPVTMTAWNAAASRLTGEVVEIGSRISPTTRTFAVRATVDNQEDTLRPGMSFRVSAQVEGRLYPVVAETAVKWGAGGAYVWLIRNDKAQRTPVRIVQRRQGRALIEAELGEGDYVVVEGIQRLRDGMAVDYERSNAAPMQAAGTGATPIAD